MVTTIKESQQHVQGTAISFLVWVNTNKRLLFDFFAEQCPYFPHHCVDVAYVLGHLYEAHTGNQATLWKVTKKHYKANWHIVLEVNQQIIDFSLFQFYATKTHIKKIAAAHELFAFCIEECQNGQVIFPKMQYLARFKERVIPVNLQQNIGHHFTEIPQVWIQKETLEKAIDCLRENAYLKKSAK